MNFQLISPKDGNGYDYNVRFRESITVPPSSCVKLNHCSLTTNTVVTFDTEQTITFSASAALPRVLPTDPASPNNPFLDFDVKLAAGSYTFPQLNDQLGLAINEALSTGGAAVSLEIYQDVDKDNVEGEDEDQDSELNRDVVIGLRFNTDDPTKLFAKVRLSSVNSLGGGYDDTAIEEGYKKTTATGSPGAFDNYGMGHFHLNTFGVADDFRQTNYAGLSLISKNDQETYTGGRALFFGLYSNEYAQGLLPANTPGRTTGGTLQSVAAGGGGAPVANIPASFFGCVFEDNILHIYRAVDTNNNPLETWESLNRSIDRMEKVANVACEFEIGEQATFALIPYIQDIDATRPSPNVYFRIFNLGDNDGDGAFELGAFLYDSAKTNTFIPFKCFVGDSGEIDYTDANTVRSQIPFTPIFSATHQDDGFASLAMATINKDNDTATHVASVVQQYSMAFSTKLGEALSASTGGAYNPNYSVTSNIRAVPWKAFVTQADYILNNRSYAIFLNGLPISNYKNKDTSSDGGFAKTILANLPAPYSTGTNIDQTQTLGNRTTVYEPHQLIESSLNNNEIVLNNFNIQIVDMDTEQPATELTKSKINFTIYTK